MKRILLFYVLSFVLVSSLCRLRKQSELSSYEKEIKQLFREIAAIEDNEDGDTIRTFDVIPILKYFVLTSQNAEKNGQSYVSTDQILKDCGYKEIKERKIAKKNFKIPRIKSEIDFEQFKLTMDYLKEKGMYENIISQLPIILGKQFYS